MRLLPLNQHEVTDERILSLFTDYFVEQGLAVASTEQMIKTLQEHKEDPNAQHFLIESQGKLLGLTNVCLLEECFPDEDLPERCVMVTIFYITPEFRQQASIHQAFKLVRQWGRDKQAALIEVEGGKTLEQCTQLLVDEGLELVGKGSRTIWRGFI